MLEELSIQTRNIQYRLGILNISIYACVNCQAESILQRLTSIFFYTFFNVSSLKTANFLLNDLTLSIKKW